MKNKFLWPVSFILSILIIGTLFIERDNTNLIVNQSNLKSESIFINQLPETQDFKSPKINVWRFNSLYIINGKKYNVSMHTAGQGTELCPVLKNPINSCFQLTKGRF